MFIELSEFLRCPEQHEETFCVVAPDEMTGRMVTRGIVGCPLCRREYPINDGVADFAPDLATPAPPAASTAAPALDPDAVWALLGLGNPGGFVVLLGSAATLAGRLAQHMGGVHFVGVNAPAAVEVSPVLTLLRHQNSIPLRTAVARGVAVGRELAHEPWLSEGARVLLKGLRLVAQAEQAVVPGVTQLAAGRGLWVGEKN